jgi:hypothetical protein
MVVKKLWPRSWRTTGWPVRMPTPLNEKQKLARPTLFERVSFAVGGQGLRKASACADQQGRCTGFGTARFPTLTPPNLRLKLCSSKRAPDLVLYLRSMDQTISLMAPAQAQIRPKAFAMSMNKEALTRTKLTFSSRSMALVRMLGVPEAGADCMFLFEERNGRTSVSATVGRRQSRTQGSSNDRLACGGGEFRDDLNAPSLERYFRARNAPYSLDDPGNPLKSQQMRAPSERTKHQRHNLLM